MQTPDCYMNAYSLSRFGGVVPLTTWALHFPRISLRVRRFPMTLRACDAVATVDISRGTPTGLAGDPVEAIEPITDR